MIWAALVAAVVAALMAWQDGVHPCNDGTRYTSKKPQPWPFHRRFCGWNETVLVVGTYMLFVTTGALLGSPQKALLFATLPGAWFVMTHPTATDAVAMGLALIAAFLFPINPYLAVFVACLAGFIHERGPVFAVLYALTMDWSAGPLLLGIGLVATGWWREPAKADGDRLVGHGWWHALTVHRPYVDWLDPLFNVYSLRGLPLMLAYFSPSNLGAWAALGVAYLSRLVGSDGARFMWWASPAIVLALPSDIPWWMVLVQVATFKRMI